MQQPLVGASFSALWAAVTSAHVSPATHTVRAYEVDRECAIAHVAALSGGHVFRLIGLMDKECTYVCGCGADPPVRVRAHERCAAAAFFLLLRLLHLPMLCALFVAPGINDRHVRCTCCTQRVLCPCNQNDIHGTKHFRRGGE